MPEFIPGLYKTIACLVAAAGLGVLGEGALWSYGPLLALLAITGFSQRSTLLTLLLLLVWALSIDLVTDRKIDLTAKPQTLWVTGSVVGLPVPGAHSTRFDLILDKKWRKALGERLRLRWYRGANVVPGERWRLQVKLRAPRNYAVPGRFDYRAYLRRQQIEQVGYVKQGARLSADGRGIDYWRYRLRETVRAQLPALGASWVGAWVLGDHSLISAQQWQWLSSTGTTHLFIVSGMHVGLMALVGGVLGRLLFYGFAFFGSGSRPWFMAVGAVMLAGCYAMISGFGVPAQRALLMLVAAMGCWLGGLRPDRRMILPLVFAAVVLIDPRVLQSPGLWLSFLAVAALLISFLYPITKAPWWHSWLVAQFAILVMLTPVLLYLGYPVALMAPALNLLAIPLTGFILLPGLLITLLLSAFDLQLWAYWAAPLNFLSEGLAFLAQLDWTLRPNGQGWLALILGLMAALCLLLPGTFLWLPAIALCFPLFWPQHERIAQGAARISMLDVGQGLSVLVETRAHRLLFDTGDRYEQFVLGQAVVEPYLRGLGIQELDRLVLSHTDRDHIGGAEYLTRRFKAKEVITGWDEQAPCHRMPAWQWDGVVFEFLPLAPGHRADNERSCVLRIQAGSRRVLLTGDIGHRREQSLIASLPEGALQADVLQVPHHGSTHSSSAEFIAKVRPLQAWISAGWHNRYGHPAKEVLARFAEQQVNVVSTAFDGTQVVELGPLDALKFSSLGVD